MEQHNYHLIKTSLKLVCPKCGKKRLVPYVDAAGDIIDPEVGRCDRECECGYHYPPRDYFANHPDLAPQCSRPHGRSYTPRRSTVRRQQPLTPPTPPTPPPSYLPGDMVRKSTLRPDCYGTGLAKFLMETYRDCQGRALRALRACKVGISADGGTIFWQIDELGRVHAGGIIHYGDDGHRLKDGAHKGKMWVHSILKRKGLLPDSWQLSQCLFGLHRLPLHHTDHYPVCVVEAEKTALILTVENPCCVWLATGGSANFNERTLAPLGGIPATYMPDNDEAFAKWEAKADELNAKGWSLNLYPDLRHTYDIHHAPHGADMADIIIDEQRHSLATGIRRHLPDEITEINEPF